MSKRKSALGYLFGRRVGLLRRAQHTLQFHDALAYGCGINGNGKRGRGGHPK